MAGICGFILKEGLNGDADYLTYLSKMIENLRINDSQISQFEGYSPFYFGNVTLVSAAINENFIINNDLNICCIIEGLVFINNEEKTIINKIYGTEQSLTNKEYLPFLFALYGNDLINKITGWYNIFLFDSKERKGFLFNDRLGYYPMFYYENTEVFIFASKLEALLSSGFLFDIEFDKVSIIEHLFFNYTLSDNTFIKRLRTLNPASYIQFCPSGSYTKKTYWHFKDLLVVTPTKKREGRSLINMGLNSALRKLDSLKRNSFNLSLTGGWDSRVVLSYLNSNKDQLNLFSFGVKDSQDIIIPQHIGRCERISYTPFILDEQYLSKEFLKSASLTINKSNGTRNFKRAHYINTFEKISKNSDLVISGIYGDEVLKISGVKSSDVISQNTIDFIASNFDIEMIVNKLKSEFANRNLILDKKDIEDFSNRMIKLRNSLSDYKSLNEKYYHIRFQIILQKFFGAEISSYNDFSYNFSPFIDFDFLSSYFKSIYCGVYYNFNSNSLFLKQRTTFLYSQLIHQNSISLAKYPTDRGYSMSDLHRFEGLLKVLVRTLFKKKKHKDAYNTKKAENIFVKEVIELLSGTKPVITIINYENAIKSKNPNTLSIYFWLAKLSEKYIIS